MNLFLSGRSRRVVATSDEALAQRIARREPDVDLLITALLIVVLFARCLPVASGLA